MAEYKGNNGLTRALPPVDGSLELADIIADIVLNEGYPSKREFMLRTIEFRYPELKDLIDIECQPKRGRPINYRNR